MSRGIPGIRTFKDRHHAGQVLARLLSQYAGRSDVVVLGLPRGGVPVAVEVAREINAPFDVLVVRKLGVPGYSELAMGALASGGVRVLNHSVVQSLDIAAESIDSATATMQRELIRREQSYRKSRPAMPVNGRTVIVVDDGLATGCTMRAAVCAVQQQRPARVVVAVPVASPQACEELQREVDECVCAITPNNFHAVGMWYEDFTPVTDAVVTRLLEDSARELSGR